METTNRRPILIICSVGFDERFIVRAIISLKLGIKSMDGLVLFLPKKADLRSKKVIERINEIIRNYGLNIELYSYEVDIDSFWQAAGSIRTHTEFVLNKIGPKYVYLMLGGGMRLLIIEILMGVIASGVNGEVIIYKEDLSGEASFPLQFITIKKPPSQLINLLRIIAENPDSSLTFLAKKTNLPKSTLHKWLKKLHEMNLISIGRKGRSIEVELLPQAHLWI